MGRFGFSYVGLLFLLMLFIPNLLWVRRQPAGYSSAQEPKILVILEKTGQIFVTCLALIFEDFNLRPWSAWGLWLAGAMILMILYEFYWLRYFRSQKTLADFYRPLLGIPLPGAVLPVAAFFLLGIYGKNLWLMAAVLLLGVGHIGIHALHWKKA